MFCASFSPEILEKSTVNFPSSKFLSLKFSTLVIDAVGKSGVVAPVAAAKVASKVSVPAPPLMVSISVKVFAAAVSASLTPLKVSFLDVPVKSSTPVVKL